MRLLTSLVLTSLALMTLACGGGGSTLAPPNNGPDPVGEDNLLPENPDPGPIVDVRTLSAPPANPQIQVLPGYQLSIFADGLSGPRHMVRRGNEVWVAERGAGRVTVLRDLTGDGYAEDKTTAVSGVSGNHGIEYARGWFYIGQTTQISRFRDDNGDRIADAAPVTIISGYPSGGHNTRTPRVDLNARKLYVSIGSSCNLCVESNQYRATIWEYNLDGTSGRMFASGLRNATGLAFRPGSNKLWAVNNGWDNLGDFLPNECMWKIDDQAFYGWPYAYTNNGVIVPDPTYGASRPDLVAITKKADWEFGAHKAPLGITFWQTKHWGIDKLGDAFVALHGSWVPNTPVGYEVRRVHFNAAGIPISDEAVVWNFRQGNNPAVGRPVEVLQFGNALLISDDSGGRIYRLDKLP